MGRVDFMKIYGYVRDENGNFEKRKRKAIEFSKLMNLPIDKMIYEQSSENYEDMAKIRKLWGLKEILFFWFLTHQICLRMIMQG